nr:hypothetical protein [Woeseiaceae bacterium]
MLRSIIAVTLTSLLLGGCGYQEVLAPRNPAVPAGVDLSGQWQLRAESVETLRQISDDKVRAAGGDAGIISDIRRTRKNRKEESLLHVFLQTGSRLKVTQTDKGLFISFDRAIVKEYTFGEYRRVNVGPVIATRVSGWEENQYVIETLDEEGRKLVERYFLEDDALLRQISI